MSKTNKKPLNKNTKRALYIVLGLTAFSSIAIVAIATIGKGDLQYTQGSADVSRVVPSSSGEAQPSPATLERLERVQGEEAKAAKVAGRSYIPENYLGSPEEVRDALDRGELDERITPSYQHYQQSSDNFTRNQSVSVSSQGGNGQQEGLGSMQEGVLRQLDGIVTNLQPATVTTVPISDFGMAAARENAAIQAASTAQTEQAQAQQGTAPLIGADEILTATLITPIDTYITQFTLAEIAGGKFDGAQLRGSVVPMNGSGEVEDVGIRFTSMTHKGIYYPIDAVALNEKTATDAMNGDVDRRYFSRIVMPILVSGLSGASTYFTARGTPSESVLRGDGRDGYGDIVVERERASREDAKNQGIGKAVDKAETILERRSERAAARPQRVTLPAYAPIGLIFNQPVYANQ